MTRWIYAKALFIILIMSTHLQYTGECCAQNGNFLASGAFIPKRDSLYIRSLLRHAEKKITTEWDSALHMTNKGLRLSLSLNFAEGEIAAYRNLTLLYQHRDIGLAIDYLTKQIALIKNTEQKNDLLIEAYALLIKLYEANGNFDHILKLRPVILTLFKEPGISKYLLPRLINSIGYAYFQAGRYDSSLYYYGSSLLLLKPIDSLNYKDVILAKSVAGAIQARISSDGKALRYFKEAYHLASVFQDTGSMVGQLSNIGVLYYDMKDYEKAKQYLYQALGIWKARKDRIPPQIYGMLATVISYYNADIPDSINHAIRLAKECYTLARNSNRFDDIIQASYTMGLVYQSNREYRKAEAYLQEGIALALEKGKIENIYNAYLNLYHVNIGLKDYKKALEYQTKYYRIKDSIAGRNNAERVTHIEQQYKTAEKDRQLAEQKMIMQIQDSKLREKNFWITSIAITGALVCLLFVVVYRNNRNKQKTSLLFLRQQQKINLLKTKAEAENEERERIGKELHDGIVSQLLGIKLNVNVIQDKGAPVDGQQLNPVARQLEEAITDLRSTAHNLIPETLLQQGLTKAIANLCDKTSRNAHIDVDFQLYGAIPKLDNNVTLSLYRMIQELIQNTLKHAHATLLLVQLSFREGILSITVEDNGIGMNERVLQEDYQTVGIANLKRRVAELNGTIDISSRPGKETTVYIEFEDKWLI